MSLADALLLEACPLDVWIALRTDGAKGSGTENDPFNGAPRYEPALSVTQLTCSGRTATATTSVAHGYSQWDVVTISGVTGSGAAFYNGTFVIHEIPDATHFSYWMRQDPGASGVGTITCARTFYQFDERLLEVGTNKRVHIGPGVFLTRGYRAYGVPLIKSGQKVIGSGVSITTLKLVNVDYREGQNLTRLYAVIGTHTDSAELEHFEISDVTLDCNLDGQLIAGEVFPQVACSGVVASGAHLRYRRVRVINFGTLKAGHECFVLWSAGAKPATPPLIERVDCVIEGCIVEQPAINQGEMTTCLHMANMEKGQGSDAGVTAYHRACVVRNCLIDCEFQINPVRIQGIAYSGTTATVTTPQPHGRANNDWVRISGALVGGSLANPYNGSFKISNVTATTFQYTMQSTPSAIPDGDKWVDRFSSHIVPNLTVVREPIQGSSDYLVTVTTVTPHYRVPGNAVVVSLVYIGTAEDPVLSPVYNGTFKVEDTTPWDPKKFQYRVASDPGACDYYRGMIGTAFQGIANDGGTSAVVENNRILNTRVGGPYHDTWSSRDLIVRNNYYRNVVNGPYQALGNVGNPISATSVTFGDPDSYTAKFTTVAPHGFTARQAVRISGVMVGQGVSPLYNGYFRIESVSSDWFTYRMTDNPGSNANTGTGQVAALFETGRCVIENNIIELIPSYMSWGLPEAISFRMWGWQDPAFANVNPRIYRQLVIRKNVIRNMDGQAEPVARNTAIVLRYCENALVENNVIDLPKADSIEFLNCTNVRLFNNRDSAGQLVQGYSGGVKQNELTTLIEDAISLALL